VPYEQTRGAFGESDATLGAPYPNDTFEGDARYPAAANEPAPRGREASRDRSRSRSRTRSRSRNRRGRDPENVSGDYHPFVTTAPNSESDDGKMLSTVHEEHSDNAGMSVPGR
jgi:hypothetical protein